MPVQTDTRRVQYNTNATTGPWSVPYYFLADADLSVTYADSTGAETPLVLDTDFTVTGTGDELGGTVTTTTAYPSGGTITILRDLDALQPAEFQDGDPFPAPTLNRGLDRLTMLAQQVLEVVGRSLRFSVSENLDAALPDVATRGGKLLGFDSVTGAITMVTATVGSALDLAVQLASSTGSTLVGWLQTGTGAVLRTVRDRLRDRLGVKDFGATGDGVTDDRAALLLADAVGRLVYVPAGTYLIGSNTTLNGVYYFDAGAVFKIATGVTLLFTRPATERWADTRQIFQCVGTGKVQWLGCSPTVYPEWWTTNATPGTTDMKTAIQAAADCVVNGADAYCPSKTTGGAGRVKIVLKTKTYRVTGVLDFNQRDYLQIIADGKAIIQSESTGYIADFSSTYRLKLRDIDFTSYTAAVGVLFNRCTSNPYCLFADIKGVNILVASNPAANGGQGTYGLINCRAEQNVWENCDIRADVPRYMTQTNDPTFPPVSGTADNVIVSLVVATFKQVNLLRHTEHNFGSIHVGVVGWKDENCYYATLSNASGSTDHFFNLDTCSGFEISGVIEGSTGFMFFNRTSYFGKINITPQIVAGLGAGGIFSFDSANNTGLWSSDIICNITSAVAGGKVMRWSGAGPSLQFFNNTLRTGNAGLIEAISFSATNASVSNVDVYTDEAAPITVASAAALPVPIGTKVCKVSGTTNITSIPALGFAGRTLTLIFQNALTFTDGSNLKLAGNLVTTGDDTITLSCDGTVWYEQSRSVN